MSSNANSVLRPGVYVPVLTPFTPDGNDRVDLNEFKLYIARLVRAGCGLVLSGTLGEGNLLSRDEKKTLVKTARDVVTQEGLNGKIPIIAGINADSTSQCVSLANDAAEAGADAVVVVAPAYYSFVYSKNRLALKAFFETIADASPVPLFLYNIPFASGGIDLDPDFLVDIS
jgi:4-hydroxy-2-oxoglutarate aldolase